MFIHFQRQRYMGRSGHPKKEVISFPESKNRIFFVQLSKIMTWQSRWGVWLYATLPHEKSNTTISLGIWMMDRVVIGGGRRLRDIFPLKPSMTSFGSWNHFLLFIQLVIVICNLQFDDFSEKTQVWNKQSQQDINSAWTKLTKYIPFLTSILSWDWDTSLIICSITEDFLTLTQKQNQE